MTIDEAIRTIEEGVNWVGKGNPPKFREACQLGIEALEEIKDCRFRGDDTVVPFLRGETKVKE